MYNHPDSCWKGSAGGHKLFRRFLECTDNFRTQMIRELMQGGALLNLLLRHEEEQVRDVKVKARFGCNVRETVEFMVLRWGEQGKYHNSNHRLQKNRDWPLQHSAWNNPMGDCPGVQKNWLIFRDHLLHAQEQSILTKGKMWTAVEWDGAPGGKGCGKD